MSSAAATGSGTPDGSSEATIALGGGPVSRDDLLAARLLSAPRPARLDRPLTDLRGVGPKLAAAAERIGLRTLGDLIEHYPHDYGDRSSATEIADLRLDRQATVIVRSGPPACGPPGAATSSSSRRPLPTGPPR